jgi:menaquinone-dependent protoporphyrinogen oxidase
MARVMVAYASKRGGTEEIGERIAHELRAAGHEVTAGPCRTVRPTSDYDAAVVGSCLYGGRWPRGAVGMVKRAARTGTPVWLFHSGPLGDDNAGEPQDLPKAVKRILPRLDLQAAVTFGGRLDEEPGGFIAGAMARNGLAGDWRDLDGRVADWARDISAALG